MKLRAAILGSGKAAQMHAQALHNIASCEAVAFHSRSADRIKLFGERYQLTGYTDIAQMIRNERIDVVVNCTPHPDHKHTTLAALQAGAHVLVEKPLASTLADCDEMIQAAQHHNRLLGVVSQRRFFEPCMRMKKAINEGKIGQPMLGTVVMLGWRDEAYYKGDPWRGSWEGEGGGVLVNQAPHQLDLLQWYMGSEFDEAYGVWTNINHPYIEVDDTAVAIIRFKNGAIGNVVVSNSQKPGIHGKVHIHGSNGASVGVETDRGAMFIAGVSNVVAAPRNDIWTIPEEESFLSQWESEDEAFFQSIDPIEYYIRLQDADFIEAIINKRPPFVSAVDGRKTVEIFTAIYESTKSRGVVKWPLKNNAIP